MTDKYVDPTKPLSDSVLNKKESEQIPELKYSDKEREYISNLQKKLEDAKKLHDEVRVEFDNQTLSQMYWENEKGANTMLRAKKNKSDINYQSGTLEDKMIAFLSSIQSLNLSPDISAFDKNDIRINGLGNALEDIVEKTNELDGDEEKQMLRQYELLKQGTVFMEEVWEQRWEVEKEITQGFTGEYDKAKWSTKVKKCLGKAKRNFLPITSVYLGDLSQYFIENQPYIFTLQEINYVDAERIYGKWDRFKYVSKEKKAFNGTEGEEMAYNAWRLGDVDKGKVQIIKYQDKPNKEYQIILNGVPMLPMGYPFPWGYDEYNITQQNLRPFRWTFAYGKSFIFKNKNIAALLDEMMKLALLKTQKSFMPAYINTSGRYISQNVLMPGRINMGLKQGELAPVSDKEAQGTTNAEFNMIQELNRVLDSKTASQTFMGAREQGGKPTATQIVELQRQARIMMGIVVLTAALMEKKLTMLRLMNILKNWFEPEGKELDESRQLLKNKYRIVSREQGKGIRFIIPTEEMPTKAELKVNEQNMSNALNRKVKIIALNPKELKQARYTWYVNVNPKEKKSSELNKLMFSQGLREALGLGLPVNMDYMSEKFAEVWDWDPNKAFMKGQPTPPPMTAEASPIKPQVNVGEKSPVEAPVGV